MILEKNNHLTSHFYYLDPDGEREGTKNDETKKNEDDKENDKEEEEKEDKDEGKENDQEDKEEENPFEFLFGSVGGGDSRTVDPLTLKLMKLLEGIDKKNPQKSVQKLKTALQKMSKMGNALQQKLGEKIVQLI